VLARSIFEFQLPPVRQLNIKTRFAHQRQLNRLGDSFSVRTIQQQARCCLPLRLSGSGY
jgi:hypothetical protein